MKKDKKSAIGKKQLMILLFLKDILKMDIPLER